MSLLKFFKENYKNNKSFKKIYFTYGLLFVLQVLLLVLIHFFVRNIFINLTYYKWLLFGNILITLITFIIIMYQLAYLFNLERENYKRIPFMIRNIHENKDKNNEMWEQLEESFNEEILILNEGKGTIISELARIESIEQWIKRLKGKRLSSEEHQKNQEHLNKCFQEAGLLRLGTLIKYIENKHETENLDSLFDKLYDVNKTHYFAKFFDLKKDDQAEFVEKLAGEIKKFVLQTDKNGVKFSEI